ncbi:TPA: dihydrodipicolinate synthase family protein [Klebsiella pneumoniae]|uniref:dihydrodipicolinate synthase family protein n=1 Tax=Klebsiella pneumoniae complex TaxID=3390273 RepID=UPI000DE66D03|nr:MULTISPECIES: dihydrodipicolinate synthase family protein [Klebsiella]WEE34560.1 dihydrodipicolinate synthase family protein [Klebsiella pneumoniae subsp. pneumoniae]CAF9643260.1 N-acetylneuraminate lyase [Klebsiella pneumoniae]CAH6262675.1 N-acetylneuraminate lyase [Klebsiella pneumoniae]SSI82062.1 N-acetylneuraminate lyase [Klebsiella pneumoniae]GKO88483.1 N-acetylneuraminate lyase [Klebsiella variicola]
MVSEKWQAFRGIISAVVTPMHADESVNYAALETLAHAQLARGVEGFYCCGSSGEGPLLRFDERKQVLATLVNAAQGKVPVIAHVGTPRTQDAVELAKSAEQDGASAVSLVPPYFYKYSREEIIAYYRRVLDAISIPVILYNIPQFTGVELDSLTAEALLGDEQVLGVKHTSHNLYSLERMIARYPDKVFFNGFDEIFLSSLAAGATATVGTTVNLQPELFLALRTVFRQGDIPKAQRLQQQINEVVENLVARGVFQSAKYLAGKGVVDTGPTREPFVALTATQREELDALHQRLQGYIADV